MKKKNILKLVALLLVFTLCFSVLSACGSTKETTNTVQEPTNTVQDTASTAQEQSEAVAEGNPMPKFNGVKISTGSGTSGGTQYVYMGGIASIVNNEVDGLELILEGTAGTGENLSLLQSGDLDIACIESSYAYNAYTGASGEAFPEIRSLFVCMPTVYAAFTTDQNATNLEDFIGKIVGVGPASGSTDISSRAVFEALGLTDKLSIQNAGWSDCITALTEGQVDAVTGQFLQPNSSLIEAEAKTDIKFVSLSEEQLKQVLDAYPYYNEYALSAGTYKGLTEDYKTFASWQAVYGTTDLSDDLAYAITRAVFENIDVLTSTVSTASQTALENIGGQPIPLHPGAYRYYVEQGIEVPDELIPPEV